MKPRLDSKSVASLPLLWPIQASRPGQRPHAVRSMRPFSCCVAALWFSPDILSSTQALSTTLRTEATLSRARRQSKLPLAMPHRPRVSAVGRFFALPRSHTRATTFELESSDRHFDGREPPKKTVVTTASSAASSSTSAPPPSTFVASWGARLRRNRIIATCPLLYSVTLAGCLAEELACNIAFTPEKEPVLFAKEMQSLLRGTGSVNNTTAEEMSWSSFAAPCASILCDALLRRRGYALSETSFVQCIGPVLASTDAEMGNMAGQMVRALLRSWTSPLTTTPSAVHVESAVRSLLESCSDVLLPVLLEALQVSSASPSTASVSTSPSLKPPPPAQFYSQAAEKFRGGRRWHPYLSDAAVKLCLQRVLEALSTAGGSGSSSSKGKMHDTVTLTPVLRHRLHSCCVCQLPPLTDDRTRHDCAVLTMGTLKGAAFPALVAAYEYFADEGLASVPVALRFLNNCGVCVPHVMQRGMSLSVYVATLAASTATTKSPSANPFHCEAVLSSTAVPRTILEPVLHARKTLLESGRELKQIEGGLVHVNAVLNALGYAADVRTFYGLRLRHQMSALSELRETPHSVVSLVQLHNVAGAVAALAELGASRPEGWVFVPPAVVQCMEVVSCMVGEEGTPSLVDALYAALIGFHNGALFISHYVELVLAGVCNRIRDLRLSSRSQQQQQLPSRGGKHNASTDTSPQKATPHEVLEQVIPVVRATLRYVGDELNADMIIELVETALHVTDYAVSLTAALIWAFRAWMDLSLCLQELLCRVDASTHNIPFLQYYALCYARDFCDAAVFDHLAALWNVDGEAIRHRAAHLSPSYQLWKCAACGRLNSDRYNYCLCSALRYSHVLCGTCGYAQDERLRQCLSCGTALLSATALSGAIARKAWQCNACGARNAAKQTLLCFRCGQPTGPRFRAALSTTAVVARMPQLKAFCDCSSITSAHHSQEHKKAPSVYEAAVGVCRTCGHFKMEHAAHHSAVWVCAACRQRRSTLERVCPSCPQVECLPHAVLRESLELPRVCRYCQHEETNPFTKMCTACGSSDDSFLDGHEEVLKAADKSPAAGTCATTADGSAVVHWCFHCQHVQPCTDGEAPLLHACCGSCGAPCEERGRCALPPRTCGQCGETLPAQYGGSAVCPRCAAYVEPAPQPTPQHHHTATAAAASDASVWNSVTVLHSCEVLEECCACEARKAANSLESEDGDVAAAAAATLPSTPAVATAMRTPTSSTFMQRRPTLERTLARLVREWTDGGTALTVATWLPMRVDVVVVLGRALNRLQPHLPFSTTARRLSALLKALLAHVDSLCGVAATGCRDAAVGRYTVGTHFMPEELCHLCLGTHPEALCPFRGDGGCWSCEECGAVNNNDDVGRYVCAGCLALRPVVRDLLVPTCWVCHDCHRANMQFERYCVHCGLERVHWTTELLLQGNEGVDGADDDDNYKKRKSAGEAARPGEALTGAAGELSAAFREDDIPFTPAKCHLCGLVFIEARCPLCQNHIPDVADAQGTVCEVYARHAFIQPVGTTRPQDRIFVDETLLQANALREGLEVHYTAELGHGGRMQATGLRV